MYITLLEGLQRELDKRVVSHVRAHWHLLRWKRHYELGQLSSGVYVYVPKPGSPADRLPPHWLCPTCFRNDVNSLYHRRGDARWECHNDAKHFIDTDGAPENYVLVRIGEYYQLERHAVVEELLPPTHKLLPPSRESDQ